MTDINPRPKAHKLVKKHMEKAVGEAIKSIKIKLDVFKEHIIDEIYSSIGDKIDDAIEEAYNEGFEDGKKHKDV